MKIQVYDSGPDLADRYTVIIDGSIFGMGGAPLSPAGFNQYCGEVKPGSGNYGKRVKIETLNADVRKAIAYRAGLIE